MRRAVRSVFPAGFDLAACLAAARAGDRQAIGRLLQYCAPYLRATLLSQVRRERGPRDSDFDIVQTALVRAFERFHKCHATKEGQLLLWLRRILVNDNTTYRREKERGPVPLEERPEPVDPRTEKWAIAQLERDEAAAEALAQLSEREQLLVIWHYIDRWTWEAISEGSGHSVDAVQKAGVRAFARFADALRVIAPQYFSRDHAAKGQR